MKKRSEKDVLGCDEQPLWKRMLITMAIYLIKTLDVMFTLFVLFAFFIVLIEIRHITEWYGILILGYIFVHMFWFDKYLTNKIPLEVIGILFVLSYLITYVVVLNYN